MTLHHSVHHLLETLVNAPETLLALSKVSDPHHLMEELIAEFDIKQLSPTLLMNLIQSGDGYAIEPDLTHFLKAWRPAGYNIEQHEINWRLITDSLPFAPFYDERINISSNQSILATLLKPRTSFDYLRHHQTAIEPVQPKGFIFHMSRCGSTLVANAMEATGHFSVISEASYLTNLLLDHQHSEQDKAEVIRLLLSSYSNPLVKFNAWDVDFLPLIHKAFPSTPMVFLIREPKAILTSHQRLSGIHMVPGNPVARQIGINAKQPLLDYQVSVLIRLMETMIIQRSKLPPELVMTLDYKDIDLNIITQIATFFGCQINQTQKEEICQIMKRYSKDTKTPYAKNVEQVNEDILETIGNDLKENIQGLYETLLTPEKSII